MNEINLKANQVINQFELNDFITKRRLLGLNYQSIINGLIDDDSLELNKSASFLIIQQNINTTKIVKKTINIFEVITPNK